MVYLRTCEEERAFQYVLTDLKQHNLNHLKVFVWKVTTGLYPYLGDPVADVVVMDFFGTLRHIAGVGEEAPPADSVYVFFNIRKFLDAPGNIQQLRDAAYAIRTAGSHIVAIGSDFDLPPELEEMVTILDFDLPGKEEIRKQFGKLVDFYQESLGLKISSESLEQAADNALGLTSFRAESAIALSIVETGGLDLNMIREEKRQILKQTGALEYISIKETMADLGGFDCLKEHVSDRVRYFRDREAAKQFGIINPPKGILLVGLPGTGKSLSAQCIAHELKLPLYRLNISALFKGVVGGSESETRRVLKIIESVAPAVLSLEEFEKSVAGLESSGKTDSGVTSRVISQILTWCQETTAPIYKVASCNTIRNLDAALLRRGRWDEVFSVDLPQAHEIMQIFSIHLRKRGRSPENFDLQVLANAASGFVGAEIESAIEEALYRAFSAGRDLTTQDLVHVCSELVPISVTDKEDMEQFRRWIQGKAKPVSRSKAGDALKLSADTRKISTRKASSLPDNLVKTVKF